MVSKDGVTREAKSVQEVAALLRDEAAPRVLADSDPCHLAFGGAKPED